MTNVVIYQSGDRQMKKLLTQLNTLLAQSQANDRQVTQLLAELQGQRRIQEGWSPVDLISGPITFLVEKGMLFLERRVSAFVERKGQSLARWWRRRRSRVLRA